METIIIEQNKKKQFLLLFIGVLMTTAAIAMLYTVVTNYGDDVTYQTSKILRYKNTSLVMSILGILFFGGATLLMIYELIRSIPLMTINHHEVVYHSGLTRCTKVEWCDIRNIWLTQFHSQKIIAISIRSINDFKVNQNWITNKIISMSVAMGQPDITISFQTTKVKPEEVLAMMNRYWEEWKHNNK